MNLLPGTLGRADGRLVVRLVGAPVVLPIPSTTGLDRIPKSGAVVLGIRPEHLHTSPEENEPGTFEAIVELAEALGHELLLHVRAGGVGLTVRGAPGTRPPIGSVLRVHVDQSRVHLFDRETGTSLNAAD